MDHNALASGVNDACVSKHREHGRSFFQGLATAVEAPQSQRSMTSGSSPSAKALADSENSRITVSIVPSTGSETAE